jgi:DNA polymerase III epsilon subunit-like protein
MDVPEDCREGQMNVMIDLETMSSRPNAAIASIGAVAFDLDKIYEVGDFTRTFYVNVDLNQQSYRHFSGDTIYWWLKQEKAASKQLLCDLVLPDQALQMFTDWYKSVEGEKAWAYGAAFDHVVLQTMFNDRLMQNPIHYRDQLCMRTITRLSSYIRPNIPGLVAHNALADCITQTIWLQRCLNGNKI